MVIENKKKYKQPKIMLCISRMSSLYSKKINIMDNTITPEKCMALPQ
jgi:hypothetical protein